jgi:hypothetical protein
MHSSEPRFRYEPSPAHKDRTTEIGPPRWIPFKEKCPPGMTVEEREELLLHSFPKDGQPRTARRYAIRRTSAGPEFYESKLTRIDSDGTIIVHGHPTNRVPPNVLRRMRDEGLITQSEYERFRRELN